MDSHIHTYKYKYKYKYVETQILNTNSWFVNWTYPYNLFVDSEVLHFAAMVSKNVFLNKLLLCIICVADSEVLHVTTMALKNVCPNKFAW